MDKFWKIVGYIYIIIGIMELTYGIPIFGIEMILVGFLILFTN